MPMIKSQQYYTDDTLENKKLLIMLNVQRKNSKEY